MHSRERLKVNYEAFAEVLDLIYITTYDFMSHQTNVYASSIDDGDNDTPISVDMSIRTINDQGWLCMVGS